MEEKLNVDKIKGTLEILIQEKIVDTTKESLYSKIALSYIDREEYYTAAGLYLEAGMINDAVNVLIQIGQPFIAGRIYKENGMKDQELELYEQNSECEDYTLRTRIFLLKKAAMMNGEKGDFASSLTNYRKALNLSYKDGDSLSDWLVVDTAKCLIELDSLDEAYQLYRDRAVFLEREGKTLRSAEFWILGGSEEKAKEVVDKKEKVVAFTPLIVPKQPAKYVIELRKGCSKHVKIGDKLDFVE